jgi:hypothetical protein
LCTRQLQNQLQTVWGWLNMRTQSREEQVQRLRRKPDLQARAGKVRACAAVQLARHPFDTSLSAGTAAGSARARDFALTAKDAPDGSRALAHCAQKRRVRWLSAFKRDAPDPRFNRLSLFKRGALCLTLARDLCVDVLFSQSAALGRAHDLSHADNCKIKAQLVLPRNTQPPPPPPPDSRCCTIPNRRPGFILQTDRYAFTAQ